MKNTALIPLLSLIAFGSGCSEEAKQVLDTNEILQSTVTETILPNANQMVQTASSLNRLGEQFCNAPTEAGLENLRFAWSGGKRALKTIEVLDFGPYQEEEIDISQKMDNWPERGTGIEDLIEGDALLNVQMLENINRSDTSTGYPALGYLLNSHESDAETVEAFAQNERRCDYLLSLTDVNQQVAERFERAWLKEEGDFSSELVLAGEGSTAFEREEDAVRALLEGMMELTNKMSSIKLGQPLQMESFEALEAPYSTNSLRDLEYNIEAVDALYSGSSLSVSDYIIEHGGGSLNARIQNAIYDSRAAIKAIPAPLSDAIYDYPETVESAVDALELLASVLKDDADDFVRNQIQ